MTGESPGGTILTDALTTAEAIAEETERPDAWEELGLASGACRRLWRVLGLWPASEVGV